MADENATLKPVVAIDATTQFLASKEIGGVRKLIQIAQSDLRGLDGKSAIATITNATPAPIPAVGQQVQYAVTESALEAPQLVSVGGVGTLKVLGNPTLTSIVLENIDATPGAVTTGAKIASTGNKGNKIHFVTAAPASTLGTDDDTAFRNTGEIYKKITGAWVQQFNYATDTELTAAIAAFQALADAFPQYLTQAEGDARYALQTALTELIDDRVAALLIAGAGITITYNDAGGALTITSTATSSSSGGHGIRDEGIDLPQRGKIDFVGAGVTATDDAAGDRTVVTIAASGGGGTGLTAQVITASQVAVEGIAYICDSSNLIEITVPATGSRFAVSNRGTGGYKIRNASGINLLLGADNVNTATKYIANTNQFSYVEFFALNSTQWIAVSSANAVFGADTVSLVKSLLHFNTASGVALVDEVSPSRVITVSGATYTASGKFGSGLNFTADSHYIEYTINDVIGTNDFCFEWVAAPASNQVNDLRWFSFNRGTATNFTSGAGGNPADGNGPILTVQGTNISGLAGAIDSGGNIYSSGGVQTNGSVFYHYAVVRNGNTFSLYRDNILQSSAVQSGTFISTYNGNLGVTPFKIRVGSRQNINDLGWIGVRDEMRLTIGDPVYTAAFTPPTAEFVYP
jgi:hypothetical protein